MTGPRGCLIAVALLIVSIAVLIWNPIVGGPLTVASLGLGWLALKHATSSEKAHVNAERDRLGSVGPPIGDVWRRLLELEGLGDGASVVAPLIRPAVRLVTTPATESPVGASRVGGAPDLPRHIEWPRHHDRPLAFLAQLDLAEISTQTGWLPLPRTGYLWCFADYEEWDFAEPGSAVVLYRAENPRIEPRPLPADVPDTARFTSCAVSLEYFDDLPDLENVPRLKDALGNDAGRIESYIELTEYLCTGAHAESPHKLLGHANTIQGPMEAECTPPANDWRLLLQVDSDGNAGMMWGDAGRLYFWIRDEDLRLARFDRVCAIMQCY
jgi:hypothetical protein